MRKSVRYISSRDPRPIEWASRFVSTNIYGKRNLYLLEGIKRKIK